MKIENLSFAYGDNIIFDRFNLDVQDGKTVCIMGSSGSGKTTLLNCINGQLNYEGKILYGQNGYKDCRRGVARVFQQPRLIPSMTLRQNVLYAMPAHMDKVERCRRADAVIEALKISDCKDSYPRYVSGGQASRAALARALAVDSDLLLMDEPFKGLDIKLKSDILDLLQPMLYGKSVIFVTHDVEEALCSADEIYVFRKGDKGVEVTFSAEIAEDKRERDMFSDAFNGIRKELLRALREL